MSNDTRPSVVRPEVEGGRVAAWATGRRHLARIGGIAAFAAALLAWLVGHTDILFADGLRYIAQAKALAAGDAADGLARAVDHPVYPAAIAVMHALRGGEAPEAWQAAAQAASVLAALLLVVPAYLLALELFGERSALVGGLIFFALPLTGHVCADTLSESTFLLFWAWGVWGALRFLRSARFGWLVLVLGASALAYLTRPEGLLLPAALVTTLVLSPRWVLSGAGGRRAAIGVGVFVAGVLAVAGPYVAMRGGLGTKPSIARLLGTAPRSDRFAVERARPLDPDQSLGKTYALAGKAVFKALSEGMTPPLLALAVVGLAALRPRGAEARQWTLLVVIGVAAMLALARLHATGGYCSPRHAIVLILVLAPAAAHGLLTVVGEVARRLEAWRALPARRVERGLTAAVLVALAVWLTPEALAPVNAGMSGYRDAGAWLKAAHAGDDGSRIVDLTGWSQFYGERPSGYTFQNIYDAPNDPGARWVVARESHLAGPWYYCQHLKSLVGDRDPVRVFLGRAGRRTTRVYVFDRQAPAVAGRSEASSDPVRR